MKQRDRVAEVLSKPISQELLLGSIPARLAYTSTDGSPRVIPIGFFLDGETFTVCTSTNAPKVKSLTAHPKVAMTIDTNDFPPRILLIRGTSSIEIVDGVPDEYLKASKKYVGEGGMEAFEKQVRGLYKQMARITISPTWAKLIDFETTMPSAIDEIMQQQGQTLG